MIRIKLYLLALFALAMIVVSANAQTPAFTYQGHLTESGLPSSGTYNMQFSIYDAVSGGAQIGTTITNNAVTVANGVFTVGLDFTAVPFTTGANRWLEIAVKKAADPGFTTLTPRQLISSSPFAIQTLSAITANGLSSLCVACVDDAKINTVSGAKITGTVANATTAGNVSGVVAIANGGTGSATQTFVDLANPQTITGAKTMSNATNVFTGSGAGLTNISPTNITPGTASINIAGIAAAPAVVTSGATPSVAGRTMLTLNYASATVITNLTGGIEGQCIVLIATNLNPSILDGTNFKLISSSPMNFLKGNTITVCQNSIVSGSPVWYETSRSQNARVQTLSIAQAGSGTGSVSTNPNGVSCGSDCYNYEEGTAVTLTATPTAGSLFAGWSGGGCSGIGTCLVTLNSSVVVAATFNLIVENLIVNRAGAGSGTVTSSPAGINCGADCTEAYSSGTVVTLTATANSGSTFAGWSGACTGLGSCVVTMSAARTVTATFPLQQFNLTVTLAGAGVGGVLSNSPGISCNPFCSAPFDIGTTVSLTASPQPGSTFAGWSGACTGTGSCVVTMTAAKSVTATFDLQPALLTVTPSPYNFGSTNVGSPTTPVVFTLTNTGGVSSGSMFSTLTGTNSNEFQITADSCFGQVLTTGNSCTVSVRFLATSAGNKVATLNVLATPGGPASSSLSGTAN